MSERVDKQWQAKGLSTYSTAAIVGTLNHYGVKLDEAALKVAANERSPLELSVDWKASWKGTGQFAPFPWAAANELIMRFYPERPTPMRVATVLMEAVALGLKLASGDGGQPAELEASLSAFDLLTKNLPPAGAQRDAFMQEFVEFIDAWAKPFNELPTVLAKQGHQALALRFAAVHETLFMDRAGCATALVRAVTGERDAAVADLTSWVADGARDLFARFAALDTLYQLEAWASVKAHGLAVFDDAAQAEKWAVGDAVAHVLAHAVESTDSEPSFMREVERRLELAHAKTGGHHHH
jgi:hypothetical protein